jgi:hypothetical protein
MNTKSSFIDLTQRPPRSFGVRFGIVAVPFYKVFLDLARSVSEIFAGPNCELFQIPPQFLRLDWSQRRDEKPAQSERRSFWSGECEGTNRRSSRPSLKLLRRCPEAEWATALPRPRAPPRYGLMIKIGAQHLILEDFVKHWRC